MQIEELAYRKTISFREHVCSIGSLVCLLLPQSPTSDASVSGPLRDLLSFAVGTIETGKALWNEKKKRETLALFQQVSVPLGTGYASRT